jgi:glycosyltransferase involved in cell wall biosynthesis
MTKPAAIPLPPDTWIVVPCFDAQGGLSRTLATLPVELHARTIVVDDGSEPPLRAEDVTLLRHPANRGYGAAQKTGYAAALAQGAQRVVLLHGDAQYPTPETLGLAWALDDADAALGSRFLVHGGRSIPWWRRWGNRLLTSAANGHFGVHLSELHTGARAFRADALEALPLDGFSDDYVFDQQLLTTLLSQGRRIAERPLEARYDDTVQSIGFRRSVRYGLGCLWTIARAPRPPR